MLPRLALPFSLAASLLLALVSPRAHAGPADRMLQPPSMYPLPMEVGALDSHVDLQLFYTHVSFGIFGKGGTADGVILGVEGQIALFDRIELGINIPFLVHGTGTAGVFTVSDTQFGNIIIPIKLKLFGSSNGPIAVSLYLDTLLPTTSLDVKDRAYTALQGGGAISGAISIINLGASLGIWDAIGPGRDFAMMTIDMFLGVKALKWLAPVLGFQLAVPVYGPDSHTPLAAILIGLEFFPIQWIHLDLATRVGLNDEGTIYNSLGRASLIFAAGFRF